MDLLVKLYGFPSGIEKGGKAADFVIRRAFAAEKQMVVSFVSDQFSSTWASECDVAFARQPPACFIAISAGIICGFACYDATARGFFGPIGVKEQKQRRGIGSALLRMTLDDMRSQGYAYAIIGGADDIEFYRAVGAVEIKDSTPGFYSGMLHDSARA
jgi:GNAT superfamily N-acetyltransferase